MPDPLLEVRIDTGVMHARVGTPSRLSETDAGQLLANVTGESSTFDREGARDEVFIPGPILR